MNGLPLVASGHYTASWMGAFTVELADDMLTVKSAPRSVVPTLTKGTAWEGHAFYEASSIRKVGGTFYFIYSSEKNHELCYATSARPDGSFEFRGTIVSNGDVGFDGRAEKDRLNHTGTTHGSIERMGERWYVFYHRLTNGTDFSRQACAEPVEILPDGSIPQVEVTSCGLNGGPLAGAGRYPAAICCNLTNGHMPHGGHNPRKGIPMVAHEDGEAIVRGVDAHTLVGYKYFDLTGTHGIRVTYRGDAEGALEVAVEPEGPALGSLPVSLAASWNATETAMDFPAGRQPLYLRYRGRGKVDLRDFELTA